MGTLLRVSGLKGADPWKKLADESRTLSGARLDVWVVSILQPLGSLILGDYTPLP